MTFFAPDLVEALGWTLLHSLWQGLVIFVLVVPALVYFKKHSPQLRYNLLCLALSILLAMMAFTFFVYLPEGGNQVVIHHTDFSGITITNPTAELPTEAPAVMIQTNFLDSINHFISVYSNQLVSVWLLGVFFFAFRWVGGIFYTYRLKNIKAQSAPDVWQQQMKQWSKKLGIRKPIKLLESAAIEVPIIIGHLKPVILLPIGTVSGLMPNQLEAIIVHELAHIRRNDFLVNLFLSGLEMILFYHPVFWWISSKIHEERELCCDDIAVAACGNPKLYARTLLLMEEKRQQNSLAMAYQGKKHHLLHRIKRICLASPASYRPEFGKAGLSLCFLFLLAAVSWAKMPSEPLPAQAESSLETSAVVAANATSFEAATLESRKQLVEDNDTMEENSSEIIQPEADPSERLQPSTLETVSASYVPRLDLDTIPYVPVIPEMKQQPKLPAIPNFPYTTEQLAKELNEHADDRSFLRNTIDQYQGSIDQWHASVKADYLGPWGDWQRTVKDAYQAWKANLKQLSKGDDIAYAVALKKGTKYFEKALREEEDAIRDSEKVIREDLEDYIKSFEATIRDHEKQQKDHDERMATHDDRMKVHDLRMSVHDGRMNIHDERMSLHDTRMSFHDSRMEAHDIIMDAFEKELFTALAADGLSKKGAKKLTFIVENGQIEVNGKALSDRVAQKYFQMFTKYGYDIPTNPNAKFVVKIDGNSKSFGTTYSFSSEE